MVCEASSSVLAGGALAAEACADADMEEEAPGVELVRSRLLFDDLSEGGDFS
jgi:hypothetical protein